MKNLLKTVIITLFLCSSLSSKTVLQEHDTLGAVSGLLILKESIKSTGYSILDFQKSEAILRPECSCHYSLSSMTTSGKTEFVILPGVDGFVQIYMPGGKIYSNEEQMFDGSEHTYEVKEEKNFIYLIVRFKKDLELKQEGKAGGKIVLAKDSVMIYCFKNIEVVKSNFGGI